MIKLSPGSKKVYSVYEALADILLSCMDTDTPITTTPSPYPFLYPRGCSALKNIVGTESGRYKFNTVKPLSIDTTFLYDYNKSVSKPNRKLGHITVVGDNISDTLSLLHHEYNKLRVEIINTPKVGVIMGSTSDWPTMKEACDILDEFHIDYEKLVVSAHRTPQRLYEYAKTAKDRCIGVIIAGAGGAAHLPGMVASLTILPVIGVPVKTSTMSGTDSLYSIVQMPPGVPVATVAIGGAKNAGILAAQILGLVDSNISNKLVSYKQKMMNNVTFSATL